MKANEIIKEEILKTIENQIKINDLSETKLVYNKLKNTGYSDMESRELIAGCLAIEFFNVLKKGEQYNKERYKSNLLNLPNEPFE